MAVVARILCCSSLTAGFGAWLGHALFGHGRDINLVALLLGCVGAIVGSVAGAAGEIVTARRRLTTPEALKPMAKTFGAED